MRIIPLPLPPWPHRTPGVLCLKHEQPQPAQLPRLHHTTHFDFSPPCKYSSWLRSWGGTLLNKHETGAYALSNGYMCSSLLDLRTSNLLAILYSNTLALWLAGSTKLTWTILQLNKDTGYPDYSFTKGSLLSTAQRPAWQVNLSKERSWTRTEHWPWLSGTHIQQATFPQWPNKNYLLLKEVSISGETLHQINQCKDNQVECKKTWIL